MIETLIGQRYRIKALIGEGGMASVYSAMDEKLERRVAIKILHPHLARNPDIRERFLLEAKTVSGLDHPNIMRVYDFSGLDSDQLWMVNEILYGEDLAEYVKAFPKQRLQFIVATLITREICRALHEAHKLNIVHRDIKPENIMMLTNGQIKLMDFGIAKVHRANATQTGIFMGSPSYMSPEQIRGTDVDSRADIYSLSVLYYEIVTGTLPFVGKTTAEVINRIMVGRYTPANMLITDLPFALNSIIVKGMQGHKEDRFQSVTEMGQALDVFLMNCQMRESRTELEEFSQNRAKFEERLSQIISTKPKGPSPVAIPLEEMSPTFRSKITRYHASYEEQMQAMEAERPQTIADHLSPLSPTGEGLEIPTSTMILDESAVPTLPPVREARAAMQAMEEAAKESLKQGPAKALAPQEQVSNQQMQQAQAQQHARQAQEKNLKPMTVAPQQKHRQTAGNFQSPMRAGTQPPKTPQSNPRSTQQRGYYREFEEEKKSNWGLTLTAFLIVAVALGFIFSSDKFLNRFNGKPDKLRPTPAETLANKAKKPKVEEVPVQTDPTPEPEEPAPTTTAPTPIESQTIVVQNDGKTKPKIPTVVPTVKQSIFSKQPPKPIAAKATKADPAIAAGTGTQVSLAPDKALDDKVPETKKVNANEPGLLKLAALPAAEVYLDGKMQGTTNEKKFGASGIRLDPGTYMLRLKRKGYRLEEQAIQIKPGEMRQINVTLTKLAELVELSIQTNKIPANVIIEETKNGGRRRELPMTKHSIQVNLKPGSYKVIVSHDQESINRTLELTEENKSINFNADFK